MNNNPLGMFQQFLSMGPNPQVIQQALFQQNPQMQVIYNQMMQSGLSPVQFVMQYAKQNNINPNVINNMYNQMLGMVPQQNPNNFRY
jgi:hypothetical protein